ncbi:MAG: leucine-rich repeat protein [Lentisphaerae bacterium]|nr:leucine-rich repeat protein [Lentisphaerota bacterium]
MLFSASRSSKWSALQEQLIRRSSTTLMHACIAVAFLFVAMLQAAEILPDQALTAVDNWLRYTQQRPLATPLSRNSDSVQSIRDERGKALCHVIALQDGGFVVTGADDAVVPIISFAAKGVFPSDRKHPLRAILQRDLPRRLVRAEQRRANPATRQGADKTSYAAQWQVLLAPYQNTRGGIELPDDLRVAPLLQSAWGQTFIYSADWEEINVYNYYTPHNYPTGCVATAGGQLMRAHEYPKKSVKKLTKECEVDGVPQALTMFGGTYAWSDMPLVPDESITEVQQQAIGKLLYDVAVSMEMSFAGDGSAASMWDLSERLRDTFHFASAKYFVLWDEGYSISNTTHYRDMLLSNFDAGYPTVMGFVGEEGGHAVAGDGYGFHNGWLYIHLNMGWAGSEDSWYHVPLVETEQDVYSFFDELLFNAFPDFSGELISGRVTDMAGRPLADVGVTAQNAATQVVVAETTTNERGIYALKVPALARGSYRVRAAFRGVEGIRNVDGVVASDDYNIINMAENDIRVKIGSRWGIDFQLNPLPFLYTVVNDTVIITGYDNGPADVVVPATIEDLPVVAIAAGAFQGLDPVTSVVLPDSVASVGENAFADCLNMQSMTFGRGVTELGEGALQNCPALASIVVPPENGAFVTDAAGVLFSRDFSALFRYPPANTGEYDIPAAVCFIQPYAFDGCANLQKLSLPGNLRDIGGAAFRRCATLTTLTLPAALESIGDAAFADSSIIEFIFLGAPPDLGAAAFPAAATVRCYQDNADWDGIETFGGCPVERIAVFHTVSFVLGDKGRTEDGQLLAQEIRHGTAAQAPNVTTDTPWVFSGWDADFSVVLSNMTIYACYAYQRELALVAGWQVIGLDFVPDEDCAAALAAENLSRYDAVRKAFVRQGDLVPGRAYWLFREKAGGTLALSGDVVEASLLPTAPGWHFVAVAANYAELPTGITDAWQWRDGRYVRTTTLVPGEGYWLYSLGGNR